jgi:hypothetical protein
MSIVLIAASISILTFGSAMTALRVQRFIPDLSKSDVRGVITQVSALVSVLLAMVLGTLVGTSFGFFFTQRANLDTFAAHALQLDLALAEYGPETKPARAQFRDEFVQGYDLFWGRGDVDRAAFTVARSLHQGATVDAYLSSLQPTSEVQKQAVARANQYAAAMEQSRLLMLLQVAGQSVPSELVAILAIWAIALFFGYGLFAPNTPTIVTTLSFGALSIGLAIFLIFDLRQPYAGVFRVSPAALEQAIDFLNK